MTDLRTRIAAALYARAIERLGWNRSWDNLGAPSQQLWLDDADAVIRELGLKRASRPSDYGHVNYPPGYQYITDWIADE